MAWLGHWDWLATPWPYVALVASAAPRAWRWLKACWRAWGVARHTRVLNQSPEASAADFSRFTDRQLVGQPLPRAQRSDDRYELLAKLQGVLATLGFPGIIVLVDRVDEPYLINGSAELMRALVWPLLDNKLLEAPRRRAEAAPAGRLDRVSRPRGPRLSPAGPAGQAEPDSLVGVDGPVAVGPGQRPASGLCGRRPHSDARATCWTSGSPTTGCWTRCGRFGCRGTCSSSSTG